jgi:AcrR family transcriptional regulator
MPRGRTRGFDVHAALDQALGLFWEHGYDGTSIADLTSAMGINAPSLYSAFGSKEALFSSAIDHYVDEHRKFLQLATSEPTAWACADRLLRGTAARSKQSGRPPGSLVVKGLLACSSATEEMKGELSRHQDETRVAVLARFQIAVADGDLPEGTDCEALAVFIAAVCDGIAVEAVAGAALERLLTIASTALLALPRPPHV